MAKKRTQPQKPMRLTRTDAKGRSEFAWPFILVPIVVAILCAVLMALVVGAMAIIWMHHAYYGFGRSHGTASPTQINLLFGFIEALAVVVGFGASLIQQRRNHLDSLVQDHWQRAEFVAQEFRTFSADRSVMNFKAILEAIKFDTPPRLQLEVVDPKNPDSEATGVPVRVELSVSMQQLINAFTPDHHAHPTNVETDRAMDGPAKWSPIEVKIVTEADQFMNYMVNFSKLYRQGILMYEDLHAYLYYFFEIMVPSAKTVAHSSKRSEILRSQLQRFLKVYYNGQTPECWEEGQCAFICAIVAEKGEQYTESHEQVARALYDETFGKIDIDPAWKGKTLPWKRSSGV